jgi:3'-phosphoadenosine 5'-phosphosulfate sulfotransferase (PAPS reductase)/FAD synthetase
MERVIVALSGGKASAWCADWALRTFPREQVVLYFNDTGWEHPDLYRFLKDLESHFDHTIYRDSDGRTPEDLFYDKRALANDRMPFCSRILKAERLQKFYSDGDILVFGIGRDEPHRARRLVDMYSRVADRRKCTPKLLFPLIANEVSSADIDAFLSASGISQPELYRLGFTHNNCSGGCVRAGKKHWKLLYEKLPEVYLDRERVEREVAEYLGKSISFFKDETLERFRKRIEAGELSKFYDYGKDNETECIGLCSTMA